MKKIAFLLFFTSAFVFCISGAWMWLRLYVDVSEEAFSLLKKVHYYAYWAFIYTLIVHIAMVIWLENNKRKGKREKHSGRSTRSKGMLFRCYKSIPDPKNGF